MGKKNHQIRFKIRSFVSVGILEDIYYQFCTPTMVADYTGGIAFEVCLVKKEAKNFLEVYEWAFSEVCDMDQEDGGSFI